MSNWRQSLIKLAEFQVEERRKRLAEIMDRRANAEMRLQVLFVEAAAESQRSAQSAEAGWFRMGYLEGWRQRRDALHAEIAAIAEEEAGARDALADAFTEQKKYEQVQESFEDRARKKEAQLETAAYDELGSRKAAGR